MKTEITRKEFLLRFLPQKKTFRTTFMVVKFGFYVFLTYFVLRVLFVLPLSAWALIGAISVFIILIMFLSRIYEEAKKKLAENKSLLILPTLLVFESVLTLSCYMAIGAIMYRMWLRDPQEAYIMIVLFLLLVIRDEYEKRSEQIASHNSGGRAPSA